MLSYILACLLIQEVTIPDNLVLSNFSVIIKFSNQTSLLVRGTLIANGTPANPIVFTANIATAPWANLQLISGSQQLSYCNFYYGGAGTGGNGMVYVIRYTSICFL